MADKHTGWIASLSNGDTVFEHAVAEGEQSVWQRLLTFLRANPDIYITQMRLQRGGVTVISTPKADGYVQCVEAKRNFTTGEAEYAQGIGFVIGGEAVVMTWLDDNKNVKTDVRHLSYLGIHAWMKQTE